MQSGFLVRGGAVLRKTNFSLKTILKCLINSLLLGFSDFQNIKIMNYGLQTQEIHPNSTMNVNRERCHF